MIVFGVGIAVSQKSYAMLAEKLFVDRLIFIGGHSQDNPISRRQILLKPVQRGSLFNARRTPCAPEVQHYDLAAKIGKMFLLAGDFQGKIFRPLSSDGTLAMAITWQGKKYDDPKEGSQPSPRYDLRADSHRMLY